MNTILLISSDKALLDRVVPLVQSSAACDAEIALAPSAEEALDFLNTEMPDLVFINFSDPAIDSFGLLNSIRQDSWLLHSGIVGFCGDEDTSERLEKVRGANIVIGLIEDAVERYLPKILDIIVKNQRILFQRSIGSDLIQTVSGSYKLDNSLIEANCYVNLLCNFLYNANKIDDDGRMGLGLALTEMFINAIEHGNCGISYDEKGAWLEEGGVMSALIEKRCQDPTVGNRRVLFEYTIAPAKSTFFIADEGQGFDWRGLKDPGKKENVHELHGRGIKLTRKYTKNLSYNDKGTEVCFEVEHVKDCANTVPGLFENIEPIAVSPGAIIFNEGASGDFLYYIAKGRYDVIVQGAVVAQLSADDIFMGEMSFLLNNRRSATVRAQTSGTLIRISKKGFVEAIKQKPHYALFLSRLLAQRIKRRNIDALDASAQERPSAELGHAI